MIRIKYDLTSIRGIDKAILERLNSQGIFTIEDLRKQTISPKNRNDLSRRIRLNEKSIYIWAKQVDLMRIEGLSALHADLLVKVGIRNVGDLACGNPIILKKLVDVCYRNENIALKESPSTSQLQAWIHAAAKMKNEIINDPDDPLLDLLMTDPYQSTNSYNTSLNFEQTRPESTKLKEASFFCDLTSLIADIGRGVAQAQYDLDKSSIEMQHYIDSHENLSNYGLTATWYAMPETTFQMKVNYAVVKETTEDGQVSSPRRIRLAPVNAKYQNYFKTTTETESELKFRIVPIPPPTRVLEPVIVPNLLGKSLAEAMALIKSQRLLVGNCVLQSGEPDNDQTSEVISQSLAAHSQTRVNDIIHLEYKQL